MSPANDAAMTRLMVETVTTGTGKAARLDERPSAGKTGTTQDFHDAWFVGFTADLVCGVWIGNDNAAPMTSKADRRRRCRRISSMPSWKTPNRICRCGRWRAAIAGDGAMRRATQQRRAAQHRSAAAIAAKPPDPFERILNSLFGGT